MKTYLKTIGPACSYCAIAVIVLASVSASCAQTVIAWGSNTQGQTDVPPTATNVIAVAAGWYHSLALRMDGSVVAWGSGSEVPASATNTVSIAAGAAHSLALQSDATVVAWGNNSYGQTNAPTSATNVIAVAAGYYHSLALRADGTVIAWGRNTSAQTKVPASATNIVAIAAGAEDSLGLRNDGSVVVWGKFTLPMPRTFRDVVAISAGPYQKLAVTGSGQVLTWGGFKRLRAPSFATNVVAIAVGGELPSMYNNPNYDLALKADGKIIAWGYGTMTNVPVSATNAIGIAAGPYHSLAVIGEATPPRVLGRIAYRAYCSAGNLLPLSARVVGSQPLHYQWLADGVPIPDSDTPFPQIAAPLGSDNVSYQVIISNAWGSVTSETAHFTVACLNVWGDDLYRQSKIPNAVSNPCAIAAGAFHLLALNTNKTVVAWGKNSEGQTKVPPTATNVVAVAAGTAHSLALRGDGSLIAWGRNWDGQTNVPPVATNVIAASAGLGHSLALRADGTVLAWGNNEWGQTNVPPQATGAIAIAAGYYHSLALRSDNTVVAWGLENAVPASATNIVAIAGGWWHSLALRADGSVMAWGDNSYGQCMVPASASNVVAIKAGYYHNLALRADGTVVAWGKGFWGATNVPAGLRNVASIATGEDYSLALVGTGATRFSHQPGPVTAHAGAQVILGTGVSGTWPLALQWFHDGAPVAGATNPYLRLTNVQPAEAGTYTLLVTNAAGQIDSQAAILAVKSEPAVAEVLPPQNVLIGTSVCLPAIVSGSEPLSCQWRLNGKDLLEGGRISGVNSRMLCLSAATSEDGGSYSLVVSNAYGCVTGMVAQVSVSSILAWGDNSVNQLEVPVGTTDVVALASGGDHSLALRPDGTIVAWGDNSTGQNNVPQAASDIIAVADGESHSLALRADGSVVAWGDNTYGQTKVPPSATNVVSIAAGRCHSLILLLDSTVLAWGSNSSRQTNVPPAATNVIAIAAGGDSSLALRADGTVLAWGNRGAAPPSATNIVCIAAGGNDVLALRADGAFFGWGGNYYGQTSVPTSVTNIVGMAAGGDHTLALLAGATVTAWGGNYFGQTLVPPQASNVVAISAGEAHSLALIGAPEPRISRHPRSCSAHVAQTAVLSASSTGAFPLSWQWFHNGLLIPGATKPFLLLTSVKISDAGTYIATVSNACGSVTSSIAVLTVISPTCSATGTATLVNSFVVSVSITDGGSGYTNTPRVRLIGGGGSGAQAVAVVSNGELTAINIMDAGYGYTNAPLVVIEPPFIPNPVLRIAPMSFLAFSNLTTDATYQLQRLVGWNWTNEPDRFTASNLVYTYMVAGVAGSEEYRLAQTPVPAQAAATAQVVNGFVVGAAVTSGGSGYVTSPRVSIVGGGGANATAVSHLSGGAVSGISITSAGFGYTSTPTIQIAAPPVVAVSPTVSPVLRVDAASLAPYDNYQVQFKADIRGAWGNWSGESFTPTGVTNSQYLFITNGAGFFRLQYVP